jgi:hypothetical protein
MSELSTGAYPIQLSVPPPASSSRFWAIPLVGIVVKAIILIPHFIVLYVLGMVVKVLQLVIWIPVLFGGHYPGWAFGLNGGFLFWYMRVTQFLYGITRPLSAVYDVVTLQLTDALNRSAFCLVSRRYWSPHWTLGSICVDSIHSLNVLTTTAQSGDDANAPSQLAW